MYQWRKSKFTLSDGDEIFRGYTDGTLWNGWSCAFFTREQVVKILNSQPNDFRFLEPGQLGNEEEYPVLIIYHGNNEEEKIEPSPLFWENKDGSITILEIYPFEGWEFMELENQEMEEDGYPYDEHYSNFGGV